MIRLEELVEAVLNEVAIAQTKATLFGIQMAADFRDHELLKYLPVPIYKIGRADVNLQFAVAKVPGGPGMPERNPFDPSDVTAAVKRVTEVLTEQNTLKSAFSLFKDQVEHWHREVAPSIVQDFEAEPVKALSVDAISTIYRYLVKTHYLLSLMEERTKVPKRRIQESIESGHPDLVGDTARQLLERELEKPLRRRAEEEQERVPEEKQEPHPATDSAVYILVEADELEGVDRVSTLRLELEEDSLDRITLSDGKEVPVE